MATSFHNKLNELEARLKAENEARKRDCLPRDLSFEGPNVQRTRPYEREYRHATNGRSSSPGGLNLSIPPRRTYLRGSPSPNSSFTQHPLYQNSPPSYGTPHFGQAQEVSGDEFNSPQVGFVQQQAQYYNQQVQYSGRDTPPSNLFNQRPAPANSHFSPSPGRTATPPMNATSATYYPSPCNTPPPPPTQFGRATPPSNLFNSQRRGAPPPSSLFNNNATTAPAQEWAAWNPQNMESNGSSNRQQDLSANASSHENGQESTTPTNTSNDFVPPPTELLNGSTQSPMDPHVLRSNLHINLPAAPRPRRVASPGSLSLPFNSPGRPASPGSISLPSRTPNITTPSPGGFSLANSPLSLNIPGRPGSGGSAGSPASPGSLSLPGSGVQRRRRDFQQPWSPASPQPRQLDSTEIELKYQEIMKNAGILTIDGTKYKTDMNDLEPMGELGHGTCGHVVRMRHKKTGHLMAVKQMHRSRNREESKRIIMDLDVVLKCHNCKYIVQSIGTFITPADVWICMELMSTCLEKLQKRLKQPIPERILGKVTVATVRALHYLKEEHGVMHRDIKPSNILLDEKGQVKLCDFGISGRLVDSKAKTRSAGCAAYMAPERIDPPDPTKPDYDIRADVWSLGISLVELAIGVFPYRNCKTDFEVLTKVLTEDPPVLPAGSGFSMDFCSFVFQCLVKDYRKRPKYKKLLEHNFIKRYDRANVDVGQWFQDITAQMEPWTPSPMSPGFFGFSPSSNSS